MIFFFLYSLFRHLFYYYSAIKNKKKDTLSDFKQYTDRIYYSIVVEFSFIQCLVTFIHNLSLLQIDGQIFLLNKKKTEIKSYAYMAVVVSE